MADHMATIQAAADRIKSEQRALEGKFMAIQPNSFSQISYRAF